jgi:hypothetical protein
MRVLIFITYGLFNTGCLFAQDSLLVNFNSGQIENYIRLTFTIHSGVTCQGTAVQRSQDNLHFETIGIMPGICGSSSSDETYMFDDSFPQKNQFNYYRINLGQLGNSHVIKVWYLYYGNEFAVVSDPLGGATIFFSNPNHQDLTFSVFTLQGEELQSIQTNGDAVSLSRMFFPNRIYFFQVRSAGTILFRGKVILR